MHWYFVTGTTECNLAMGKYNDAMMSAKTALKLKPNSSKAFAHVARVMSKSDTSTGRKEVGRCIYGVHISDVVHGHSVTTI
jgi:hypothetical protein